MKLLLLLGTDFHVPYAFLEAGMNRRIETMNRL
jgi:hypothetical protein